MVKLNELLERTGVTKVIWIDDKFSEKNEEQLKTDIKAKILTLLDSGIKFKHTDLSSITPNTPEIVIDKKLENILQEGAGKLPGIDQYLNKELAENNLLEEGEEGTDFSRGQVESLRKSFSDVYPCSYHHWINKKEEIFSTVDKTTLFLIDREFTLEQVGKEEGELLLEEIVSRAPSSYSILFTHTIASDRCDEFRNTVAQKIDNLQAHQFSVMSKRGLGNNGAEIGARFSRALKTVVLCRFSLDIGTQLSRVMNKAMADTISEMSSFPLETIDTAIFENSLHEGASEIDVVERILAVNQRRAAHKALIEKTEIWDLLQRIRDVRDLDLGDKELKEPRVENKLHEWRRAEVFDAKDYLNPIHSPLRCGDIFEHTEDETRYVLLAQPCDLMVRGNGNRRREEAEFAKLNIGKVKSNTPASLFEIENMEIDGRPWVIDFRTAFSIDLRLLELSVFDQQGKVEWRGEEIKPKGLLPGWQKRYDRKRESFDDDHRLVGIGPFCRTGDVEPVDDEANQNCYALPLVRVGRIRFPYAKEILASYAVFLSRAALSHDFAKNLREHEQEDE